MQAGVALGIRFLDALAEALAFITERPLAGSPLAFLSPRLNSIRSWPIAGFEDVRVYYLEPVDDVLDVVRVLHGRRDLTRVLGTDE